jgi:anti-sigma factor RsiW
MLQCRDIDALMMDWLYGELEPQKAQSFSSHLEDCSRCHTELAAFERTRELVGGLPTEEPPSAVSAMLIREAALAAPTAATSNASEGGFIAWLRGLFQPLQHPALAAVATLVLVAGVAGTFYLRDGDKQFTDAEAPAVTTESSEGAAPAQQPPAPETPAVSADAPDDTDLPEPEPSKIQDETARRADLLEAKREEAAKDLLDKTRAVKQPPPPGEKKGKVAEKNRFKANKPNAVSGGDPLGGLKLDSDKSPETSFEGDGAPEARPYRAYRDRPDSWVNEQQLRITEAYNREDCVTAARIANDILDRSPELYTKSTKDLEGVKRCKAYVAKETQKRRIARQKRGKSSGKAAGKAKRAPKSEAPAADFEAAEQRALD